MWSHHTAATTVCPAAGHVRWMLVCCCGGPRGCRCYVTSSSSSSVAEWRQRRRCRRRRITRDVATPLSRRASRQTTQAASPCRPIRHGRSSSRPRLHGALFRMSVVNARGLTTTSRPPRGVLTVTGVCLITCRHTVRVFLFSCDVLTWLRFDDRSTVVDSNRSRIVVVTTALCTAFYIDYRNRRRALTGFRTGFQTLLVRVN